MPRSDLPLKLVCRTLAVGSATIVLLILGFLVRESWPAFQSLGFARFFSDDGWHPVSGQFGLMPMIAATIITSLGGIVLAAPLGIASAVFVQFYAPSVLVPWHRRLVELLAGIPSVVFGLWGLVVVAPLVAGLGGSGQNLLTASIILGLMILPTIALLSDSAIGSVPRVWTQGAAALGLQRSAIVAQVVLPAAGRGISAALVLAITRALGETMAVLMVAGNVVQMPTSLLSPGRTLNANIALELGYASADHRSVLFVSGLMLMLIVGVLVVAISRRGGTSYARR
ncbi:phosphate ABC transporter permease subunit PstC [Blastopirellula marina]|uniref:Phosphate transport system permease protein n=1 Tax=Blastopirellula marina TaxID=124 RepID=A0A2S8EZG4_9BACT|nr:MULTISPECIES: phosphate ABC transporter permease subunit PstC [Pirellulaceae]PQO25287.1 phosphate ABC transporter permease subunit PstC [Blastopirellula marina]RCS41720.1 phosphate ABC transporter permease subunit PstC [Bremerella cremea]